MTRHCAVPVICRSLIQPIYSITNVYTILCCTLTDYGIIIMFYATKLIFILIRITIHKWKQIYMNYTKCCPMENLIAGELYCKISCKHIAKMKLFQANSHNSFLCSINWWELRSFIHAYNCCHICIRDIVKEVFVWQDTKTLNCLLLWRVPKNSSTPRVILRSNGTRILKP